MPASALITGDMKLPDRLASAELAHLEVSDVHKERMVIGGKSLPGRKRAPSRAS